MVPAWLLKLFGGRLRLEYTWILGSGYKNPDYKMPEPKRIRLLKLTAEQVIHDFEPKLDIDGNIIATFCNTACDILAKEVWGFKGFTGMMANQIVDRMKNAPDFAEIDPDAAQKLANDGRMVVAGFKNDPHGHVAVCFMGSTIYSGKWGCNAPFVVNVGKRNGIMNANFAFRERPQFWAFIENVKEKNNASET